MTTQPIAESKSTTKRNRLVAGIALIAIGAVVFLAQITNNAELSWLVVPALALIFLAWGLFSREFGLLIPGGILAGIAGGIYLVLGPLSDVEGEAVGGAFLLAFAAGWGLISLLSFFTHEGFHWWPLIPGGILALIGLALLSGGMGLQFLKVIGYAWPLILVGVGVYLLLRRRQ